MKAVIFLACVAIATAFAPPVEPPAEPPAESPPVEGGCTVSCLGIPNQGTCPTIEGNMLQTGEYFECEAGELATDEGDGEGSGDALLCEGQPIDALCVSFEIDDLGDDEILEMLNNIKTSKQMQKWLISAKKAGSLSGCVAACVSCISAGASFLCPKCVDCVKDAAAGRQAPGEQTVVCAQKTYNEQVDCLRQAACAGAINPKAQFCTILGQPDLQCPECLSHSSSKKGLLGLLGLLAIIPVVLLLLLSCIIALVLLRRRRAAKRQLTTFTFCEPHATEFVTAVPGLDCAPHGSMVATPVIHHLEP